RGPAALDREGESPAARTSAHPERPRSMTQQQIPDVRVRLSAEGVDEIVRAFQKVAAAGKKSGGEGAKGLKLLSGALGDVAGLLPTITVAAGATGLALLVKDAIESADAMGKLSAKTGVSTETLSTLAFAADLADANFDQLSGGLVKFNKTMGDLDRGGSEA